MTRHGHCIISLPPTIVLPWATADRYGYNKHNERSRYNAEQEILGSKKYQAKRYTTDV
jgi:hypothetical protein